MKIKLLIIGLLHWIIALQAQETASFVTKNEQLQQDFYQDAAGTKGLLLSFEYFYTNAQERLSLHYPTVALYQNGTNVYLEQQEILPLQTNTWAKATIFIPYRKINLFQGLQENVMLTVKLDKNWEYNQSISYQQPRRFKVDIQVRKGEVKEKLIPYDEQVPAREWLPDPYFTLTTNGGTQPLFQSKVAFNQYQLPTPAISIYLLEGEQLQWSFYDRDGAADQLLGVYNSFEQEGTVYEDYYGLMFGSIKNLDFTYSRKVQAPQAINVYHDPTYQYQRKKGVAFTVKYDLPEAFIGQQAQPVFEFYDKNGIQLNIPVLYPLNGAAELDEQMTLKRRGELQYFVPFYIWKEACHSVAFSFLREDGEKIRAARHFLRQVIEFEDWVIDADLAVLQGATFQGAKGVELKVSYELLQVYENAPLYIKFYQPDGTALPFKVYAMEDKNIGVAIDKEHKINQPRAADEFSYFVPYSVLENQVIGVQAELLPDVAMAILEKYTPVLSGKGQLKDVQLTIAKTEERFRSDNYGQVVELKVDIPPFYKATSQLHLDISENGQPSQKLLVEGAQWHQNNHYLVKNDSGNVYLVLPHRNIAPGTNFKVKAHVLDAQQKRPMSELVEWSWTAPKDLFNNEIEVELLACKFDKKLLRDTSLRQNFPWEYVIKAGHDVLTRIPLSQKFARDKEQFNKKIQVNREDNITIQLVNTKTKRALVLFKGDLSKWEQSGFKTILEDKYPVRMAKIVAKVPVDYNSNTPSTPTNIGKL